MVRVKPERLRRRLVEFQFHRQRRLAAREPGTVADAKDVRVDGERLVPEGGVHHHVGGLPPHARQPLQRIAKSITVSLRTIVSRMPAIGMQLTAGPVGVASGTRSAAGAAARVLAMHRRRPLRVQAQDAAAPRIG